MTAGFTREELEEALCAVSSMILRTEKVKDKFAQGTSQNTLQRNRLAALQIASSLIIKELGKDDATDEYAKNDLEKAVAPIASLISKSGKAQKKLAQGTWQYTMLKNNLKALNIASALITKVLNGTEGMV
jgi:hypothetical protein